MAKRKKKSKKANKGVKVPEPDHLVKAPHTFVIKRGQIGHNVAKLLSDMRKVLEPFTAAKLRVKKKNVLKDFVSVAGYLNVTHLLIFTKTTKSVYLRVCRLPQGPTLTYKIVDYCLARSVISAQKKPLKHDKLFDNSPLIVMNGFTGPDDLQLKLTTSMWRNMFPSIDINNVELNNVRRAILLNYQQDTKLIDFRHYAIKLKPVGISRTVKKLVTSKRIPDLGKLNDYDDVLQREIAMTESEGEAEDQDEARQVTLPQPVTARGNLVNEKSAIRLIELGPKMTLELVKIEDKLMAGEVLYHALIKKTKKEIKEANKQRLEKIRLKLSRKRQQEENVLRKQQKQSKPSQETEQPEDEPDNDINSDADDEGDSDN